MMQCLNKRCTCVCAKVPVPVPWLCLLDWVLCRRSSGTPLHSTCGGCQLAVLKSAEHCASSTFNTTRVNHPQATPHLHFTPQWPATPMASQLYKVHSHHDAGVKGFVRWKSVRHHQDASATKQGLCRRHIDHLVWIAWWQMVADAYETLYA